MTNWALGALGVITILLVVLVRWIISDTQRGRARARLTLVTQDSATAGDNTERSVAAIAARLERDRLAATPAPAAPEAGLGIVLEFRPRPGPHPTRQRPAVRRSASSRQPRAPVRLRLSRNGSDRV